LERPEPPPEPSSDDLAEDRATAIAAREASEALQRLADLARLTRNKPDGYTLHDLDELAKTCRGWAFRLAMAAGADDLMTEWTKHPGTWRRLDGPEES
jgi:hypothetical protein